MDVRMNHGSLFSGIGGFDLAAEWMGWNNVFHCEWNEFGKKILKHYWPNSISYDDITKSDFTIHRGAVDILTGGFPCQPYSQSGKRKGKEDERHLWPEMLRAIREIQPAWVVGENVRGIITWNGGLVFNEVQTDLEAEGYEVQPFLLPAAGINAPHERYRTWFIAYSESNDNRKQRGEINRAGTNECRWEPKVRIESSGFGNNEITSNTQSGRNRELRNESETARTFKGYELFGGKHTIPNWNDFPTQSPIRGGDDGVSSGLDGITFSKWRNESIKAYGNAIVPQVAHQIFKAIQQYESTL